MLTTEEVKRHCRIDHNDEDALLLALIDTAIAACADYLNMEPLIWWWQCPRR